MKLSIDNENVTSVLVERVPCAFAKPTADGKMGTHYVMVLLGRNKFGLPHEQHVLYVGCECLHTRGEGIAAMHEMGDGNDTCYTTVACFYEAHQHLSTNPQRAVVQQLPKNYSLLPPQIQSAFSAVFSDASNTHNRRVNRRLLEASEPSSQYIAFQHTIDQVTASLLNLPCLEVDHGNHATLVQNTSWVISDPIYPRVFQLHKQSLAAIHVWEPEFGAEKQYYTLSIHGELFAVRHEGIWTINEDALKSFADSHHTVFDKWSDEELYKDSECLFCQESFERMGKHTKGARHIDRVLEVGKMVCKATSRIGLQMLNDSRRRSVFIKR